MAKRLRRKGRLEAPLAAAATPVFAVDHRRRVIFFNSGCESLTGWTAEEALGALCNYIAHADPARIDSLAGSLCPPPEVFEGNARVVPATIICRDGSALAQLIHFFPLRGAGDVIEQILGILTPIAKSARRVEASPSQQLHAELAALRVTLRQRFGLESLICRSDQMLRVAEQIRAARQTTATVFLQGEKGTGKEHVARALHGLGPTSNRAFVPVDCARLPAFELKQTLRRLFPEEDLQSAEESPVPGLQPGSIYLQNVEALPRDLQEFVVQSIATSPPWKANERRLISGSSGDLRRSLADEVLRRDFYFLLTPIQIEIPPLRSRQEDLAPLAQSILEDLNRGDERQVGGFADDVWEQFRTYHWPGNVDELVSVVVESRGKSTDGMIRARDLPFRFRAGQDAQAVGPPVTTSVAPLEPLLVQVETDEIRRALEKARNNKTKAAELLGITRPRLYRRMQTLGIEDREDEKGAS